MGRSSPTNVLPAGANAIPLPSEQCEETFHVTSKTEVLLLDETTAKRRQVLHKFDQDGSAKAVVLPTGENVIRLESKECEDKFHLSDATKSDVLLLQDH